MKRYTFSNCPEVLAGTMYLSGDSLMLGKGWVGFLYDVKLVMTLFPRSMKT